MGSAVFDRTTRRVALTTSGEEFLPTAERLLADFAFAIEDLHASAKHPRERVRTSIG